MNTVNRTILRTAGALGFAAVACCVIVSAAPGVPEATTPASFSTAVAPGADRATRVDVDMARVPASRPEPAHAARAGAITQVRRVRVWTSGGQAAINACRGAVDLTRMYGIAVIAEHWSCGGSAFPTTPGSIVVLTGLRSGSYRVLGVVATLNAYTQNAGDVPRRYQLLFQTCYRGDSRRTEFIALRKSQAR